ncbi:MAG: hypothetical protein KGI00_04355 [Candidatus Micrarchaeota archaeon]|nr:hypothetical protein [Candidatus Micrarchaeota archaeon]MDE1824041.1 hypothetical protein [Candidatus Micrarchaeota archaeon]MDE1849931.1 hypothetical protein [Candidatus Micrarchaeota archaeon]
MKYYAFVNRKFNYTRVYEIKKRLKGNTNAFTRAFLAFLNKYVYKKSGEQSV